MDARLISELAIEEREASYDHWFRAKVQAAIDDLRRSQGTDRDIVSEHDTIKGKRRLAY